MELILTQPCSRSLASEVMVKQTDKESSLIVRKAVWIVKLYKILVLTSDEIDSSRKFEGLNNVDNILIMNRNVDRSSYFPIIT